jgi:hypothetical protein
MGLTEKQIEAGAKAAYDHGGMWQWSFANEDCKRKWRQRTVAAYEAILALQPEGAGGQDTRAWVCAKCGFGSTEHGLNHHPASNCVYEPVLTQRPAEAAKQQKGVSFLCGAWRKMNEGPMDARRTLVTRCDLEKGHEGDHVDRVLLVNWSDDKSDPECRPRNEWNTLTPAPAQPAVGDVIELVPVWDSPTARAIIAERDSDWEKVLRVALKHWEPTAVDALIQSLHRDMVFAPVVKKTAEQRVTVEQVELFGDGEGVHLEERLYRDGCEIKQPDVLMYAREYLIAKLKSEAVRDVEKTAVDPAVEEVEIPTKHWEVSSARGNEGNLADVLNHIESKGGIVFCIGARWEQTEMRGHMQEPTRVWEITWHTEAVRDLDAGRSGK